MTLEKDLRHAKYGVSLSEFYNILKEVDPSGVGALVLSTMHLTQQIYQDGLLCATPMLGTPRVTENSRPSVKNLPIIDFTYILITSGRM